MESADSLLSDRIRSITSECKGLQCDLVRPGAQGQPAIQSDPGKVSPAAPQFRVLVHQWQQRC